VPGPELAFVCAPMWSPVAGSARQSTLGHIQAADGRSHRISALRPASIIRQANVPRAFAFACSSSARHGIGSGRERHAPVQLGSAACGRLDSQRAAQFYRPLFQVAQAATAVQLLDARPVVAHRKR
jgi:hypothetical protein